MEFRDLAKKESASLFDRLAKAYDDELTAVREREAATRAELQARLQTLESEKVALSVDLQARIEALEEEKAALTSTLADERARHTAALEQEGARHASALDDERTGHAAALDEAEKRFAASLAEAAKQHEAALEEERSSRARALAEALAQHAEAVGAERTAHAAALDETHAAHARELKELEKQHTARFDKERASHTKAMEAERAASKAMLEAERAKSAAARAELGRTAEALAHAESGRRQSEEARKAAARTIEELRTALDAKQVEATALASQLEDEAAERAKLAASMKAAQKRLKREHDVPLDRLRTAFHRFAGCRTGDDIMAALVQALAAEFSRVALFALKGERLEGRRQVGFEFSNDLSKLVVPVQIDSLLAQAVKSGQVQGETGTQLTDEGRALFGGSPGFAVALPIVVSGQVTAVIYADDSGQAKTDPAIASERIKLAELLFWYVVPMLQWLDPAAAAQATEEAAAQG